jgi:DNA-binding MurR/RpiR family transcriptional regulator
MSPSSVGDLIAAAAPRLTPTERRIAEVVGADPTLLAFGTVSDLATRVGTSRPSIVRFAAKLGFAGYAQLQGHVRRVLSHELKRPTERIRLESEAGGDDLDDLEDSLAAVLDAAGGEQIATASDRLASASAVWVVSGETSRAGAMTLVSGLSMLRDGVTLLEEHTLPRELARVGRHDAAVAFGFYRYRRWAVQATELLARRGAWIVAVTDGPLSPLAALADVRCEVRVPAMGPFDSSVTAVALAELLVARVAKTLDGEAMRRIDLIEESWEAAATFLPD